MTLTGLKPVRLGCGRIARKHVYSRIADESGKKTRNHFDAFGNQVKTILGPGAAESTTTTLFFNVLGQRTKVTDPRSLNTTYLIDTRGLLTTKTSPDAGAASSQYDQAGNLRYSQDANQAAAGQVFFTTYDVATRPLVSGQASTTFSSLDPFTSASFESTTGNWLVVRQYDVAPSAAAFPWSLFPAPPALTNVTGRLAAVASKSNGSWQVTLFSYDPDGRVVKRSQYTHANGGTTVLAALSTTDTLTLDLRGALTRRGLTVGANSWYQWSDYDGRGLLGQVSASTSTTKPGSPDVTYTYRPSGQLASRQFTGGPVVPLKYSIRERLDSIGNPASTSYPFSARYAYYQNGTVSEAEFYNGGAQLIVPAAPTRYRYAFGTASYDALNRLKSADYFYYNAGWTSTAAYDLAGISYDLNGNMTALQRYRETGTLVDNLTKSIAGSSNRLTSLTDAVGTTAEAWDAESGSFTYDANGNTLTAPAPYSITTVTYDYQNLPLSLTRSGVTTTYRYAEGGQRIAKQVGTGNREMYVLDGATPLSVVTVNSGGTVQSWYWNVVAGQEVVGRQPSSGDRRFYHTDLLGSTQAVTDSAVVLESYDFDPWGVLMPARTLGSGTTEGFTGKERDAETGLDYFGARYDMSALARWTTSDPMADEQPEWSPYNYVLNNPALLTDPDGNNPCIAGPIAIRVCAAAASAVGMAIGGALGRIAYNASAEDRGLFEGVGTAFLEGAREGAVAALVGEGVGTVAERAATYELSAGTRVAADATAATSGTTKANAAQGARFEASVVQQLEGTQTGVVRRVTVKTQSGVRTVIDAVGRDPQTGAVRLTEAKSSATGRLTPNPRAAFPEIQTSGATVVGAGKPGFKGGTKIPPTPGK